jgi:multiple sugar transport system ATP-binding protein
MASVSLQGLRKSFGTTPVLRDVSLDIRDGEFLTLVGPSGCGKTTLLRILAGLDHADAGTVRIGERVVDALPPKQRDVAMVFQSYALYPYMTVRENIAMPMLMRRLGRWQRLPLLGAWLPGSRGARKAIDAVAGDTPARSATFSTRSSTWNDRRTFWMRPERSSRLACWSSKLVTSSLARTPAVCGSL